MAGDFKDLARRTASDKVLKNIAFNIAENPKYDGYQRWLASMVYKCFFNWMQIMKNQPKNYTNQLLKKNKKSTVYSGFKDNIWVADLADMQLISKFNKGFRFLLCVIDIFSKYAWVVPLKDKKRYYKYQCFSENCKRI